MVEFFLPSLVNRSIPIFTQFLLLLTFLANLHPFPIFSISTDEIGARMSATIFHSLRQSRLMILN